MATAAPKRPSTSTKDTSATNGRLSRRSARLASRARSSRSATSGSSPSRSTPTRAIESCRLLNEILADSQVLYALYKKHHWLVAGPTFYQLHLLFDKHAEEQLELVDLIAERVQVLGGIAVGDPRHAAELTSIERAPDGAEEVTGMLDRLLDAHESVIERVRAAIKTDRGERGLGHERPADGRRPPPARAPGLVRVRAPGRHPAGGPERLIGGQVGRSSTSEIAGIGSPNDSSREPWPWVEASWSGSRVSSRSASRRVAHWSSVGQSPPCIAPHARMTLVCSASTRWWRTVHRPGRQALEPRA